MIRFSASLVVVALGLLVAGGVTSKLLLVYVAVAVSAIAVVFLIIGAILNRGELRASSPAEAPGDRLEEASAGRLDRAPAGDRDEAGPGRLDRAPAGDRDEAGPGRLDRAPAGDRDEAGPGRPGSVAAGVPGDDLTRRPDRLVAGARADDPGMHSEAPMARPDAATVADTKGPGDIADHTDPSDNSSSGDTENIKGTGGAEDLADTQSADQPVTVVPGVPRYHRRDCILIRFMGDRDLRKMPVEAAKKNGCTPCRACHTDGEERDGEEMG